MAVTLWGFEFWYGKILEVLKINKKEPCADKSGDFL
jgi:hypothetical protein